MTMIRFPNIGPSSCSGNFNRPLSTFLTANSPLERAHIQYIFLDGDDIILAGPVGGIDSQDGWFRDRRSGLNPLRLDFLATTLASATATASPGTASTTAASAGSTHESAAASSSGIGTRRSSIEGRTRVFGPTEFNLGFLGPGRIHENCTRFQILARQKEARTSPTAPIFFRVAREPAPAGRRRLARIG